MIAARHLTVGRFARPGIKRLVTNGIVWHWVGAAGQGQDEVARYFELLGKQDPTDAKPDTYASAHYIIGIHGGILEVIPSAEIAYHCGAAQYTPWMRRKYPQHTTNEDIHHSANGAFIGVELCHPDATGEFTTQTFEAAVWLGLYLMREYRVPPDLNVRHFDVTGKLCPKWWVENIGAWDRFWLRLCEVAGTIEGV